MTIAELMVHILKRHAEGIHYREWNAGPKIDECMVDTGFNVDIYFDEKTGFLMGGNENNCGTWMDKMGSSFKTGNRGKPATPRDGAPVELVGLLYSVLTWMGELNKKGDLKENGTGMITWEDWAKKIKENFEPCFWIGEKK